MLRALSLLLLVLFAAPAAAQDYQSKELAEAGVNYRQELVSNVPANKRQPSLIRPYLTVFNLLLRLAHRRLDDLRPREDVVHGASQRLAYMRPLEGASLAPSCGEP